MTPMRSVSWASAAGTSSRISVSMALLKISVTPMVAEFPASYRLAVAVSSLHSGQTWDSRQSLLILTQVNSDGSFVPYVLA